MTCGWTLTACQPPWRVCAGFCTFKYDNVFRPSNDCLLARGQPLFVLVSHSLSKDALACTMQYSRPMSTADCMLDESVTTSDQDMQCCVHALFYDIFYWVEPLILCNALKP